LIPRDRQRGRLYDRGVARIAIAVVCAAAAAAVLIGGGGASVQPAGNTRTSPLMLAFTAQTRTEPQPEVFGLRRDGTVTSVTHGPGRVVSWSPDGRELLIVHPTFDYGGAEQLEALNVTTGRSRPLWRATTLGDAAWSPDGQYIAVEWDGKVSVLGPHGEIVRSLGEEVPTGAAAEGSLAWSADGSRLAVTYAMADGTGIAIEQPEGVIPKIMSPCGDERPCRTVLRPAWGPGQPLLMVRRGHGASLWWWTGVGPPAPFSARGLPRSALSASWAPDGHRVAVATGSGVYLVQSPGATAERITATRPLAGPSWSADGRRIAIVTRAGTGGPNVLDVLVPAASGNGPASLQTSSVFEHIIGPLVWNPAG
jgi:dipeptidyl aminopeptidase/acylaminoacyl peptidase